MASEIPIQAEVSVIARRDELTYLVALPNGKQIVAHLAKRLRAQKPMPRYDAGDRLRVEMTPYDFSKARIAGLAGDLKRSVDSRS